MSVTAGLTLVTVDGVRLHFVFANRRNGAGLTIKVEVICAFHDQPREAASSSPSDLRMLRAVSVPFALLYMEKRVLEAVCCRSKLL